MLFDQAGKGTVTLLAQPPESAPLRSGIAPRLELRWGSRWQNLGENLLALLHGPAPPKKFRGAPYFRDCWVSGPRPNLAFLTALLWHAVVILLLVNFGQYIVYRPRVTAPSVEITWYGSVRDLPLILPATPKPPAKPYVRQPPTVPKRGAEAFHPRQTILNRPLQPNHPRQTLIQPAAPPEPPKILPPLPNIVAWSRTTQPELHIDPALLQQMQPKAPTPRPQVTAAPEIPNQEKLPGAVNISDLGTNTPNPALPIAPMSAPHAAPAHAAAEPPPNLTGGAGSNSTQLIALSANPAPAMPPTVPPGNLSSRVSISPQGPLPGSPGSPASGSSGSSAGAESGSGPAGLTITGGKPRGLILSSAGRGGPAWHVMPGIAAATPRSRPLAPASRSEAGPLLSALKPGMRPEALLGAKHVYTLHINMPNMTSAAGSWIMSFSELAPAEETADATTNPPDLRGPEPLRKVDPKYPPELRDRHIQGEVILYAVIRKNGTVDSIQLVQGIDPTLDTDAMQALAQWKFRPAVSNGHAIALQAIVHIPFRAVAPTY